MKRMSPLLERILAHALPIGLRVGGMMTFAPFFGSDALPARVKAAFVMVLTAMLYGVCPVPDLPLTAIRAALRIASQRSGRGLDDGAFRANRVRRRADWRGSWPARSWVFRWRPSSIRRPISKRRC